MPITRYLARRFSVSSTCTYSKVEFSLTFRGTELQAIGVAIAVIDPGARALIPSTTLLDIASDLDDFKTAPGRGIGGQKKVGDIEYRWNTVLFGDPLDLVNTPGIINRGTTTAGSTVPHEVVKSIRVYVRYFDFREQ